MAKPRKVIVPAITKTTIITFTDKRNGKKTTIKLTPKPPKRRVSRRTLA